LGPFFVSSGTRRAGACFHDRHGRLLSIVKQNAVCYCISAFREGDIPSRTGEQMATSYDFKKLRTSIKIYVAVQVFLLILLAYVGFNFQLKFQAMGKPDLFLKSALISLLIQLLFFFPINKFAQKESEREIASLAIGLSTEALATFRRKRLVGEFIKVGVFIFFVTFSFRAPQVPLIQCTIFITFILTMLSYVQCHNFAAKRQMKEKS
jgi:hypothetical protein